MTCDMCKPREKREFDPNLVAEMVGGGHLWALKQEFPGGRSFAKSTIPWVCHVYNPECITAGPFSQRCFRPQPECLDMVCPNLGGESAGSRHRAYFAARHTISHDWGEASTALL